MDLDSIYSQIEKLSIVELFEDPIKAGLTAMNAKLAEIQNKKSQAAVLSNKIITARGKALSLLNTSESIYGSKLSALMSSDERVRVGKSKDDRAALANSILKDEYEEVNDLRTKFQVLDTLRECIENCLHTIKTAKETISNQLRVIQMQIQIGEVNSSDFFEK